jgi:hypothetical protein
VKRSCASWEPARGSRQRCKHCCLSVKVWLEGAESALSTGSGLGACCYCFPRPNRYPTSVKRQSWAMSCAETITALSHLGPITAPSVSNSRTEAFSS